MRNFNIRPSRFTQPVAYFAIPKYGSIKDHRGTEGHVILGPDYDRTDRCNSGFPSGTLDRFGLDDHWVAGHIINQDMGGYAVAGNLVPLTAQANRGHSTCENYGSSDKCVVFLMHC